MSNINVSGSFLNTMSIGRGSSQPSFDLETSAKTYLQLLALSKRPLNRADLGRALSLSDEQTGEVTDYLQHAGMVQVEGDKVMLSGYGSEALDVFDVS